VVCFRSLGGMDYDDNPQFYPTFLSEPAFGPLRERCDLRCQLADVGRIAGWRQHFVDQIVERHDDPGT
jgi:hypothetical protein